ncbi:hypothetical protein DFR67_103444 [Williamsia limnetica]|uniref:Uncharacterized protein n=1 Tax=Williamsia limnetica TaxID=882452 RepID=A0A318RPI8_WILLI|nr:hypothetical protein DFR67_103444 [Williamsia limnetica]
MGWLAFVGLPDPHTERVYVEKARILDVGRTL